MHVADNRLLVRGVQTALRLLYPARCVICGDMVESDFSLCGACWRETPLIGGLVCDFCGLPLQGAASDQADRPACDECLHAVRPWRQGRSALLYQGNGRKLVLMLKHGDRTDVLRPAVHCLARAARPMLCDDTLIAPVPLHWQRFLRRRFNQSALLARGIAQALGADCVPDLLLRPRKTAPLDGISRAARFERMAGAIVPNPDQMGRMAGRSVLLVDDVMTSGATLLAATEACFAAQARDVCVVTLARVAKDT
jgi:predicted amidophosphoribosyltransferase